MRKLLHNDEPVSDGGLLQRDAFVRSLAEQVAACTPPQVFGVHGEWGAGKTSVLRQLQRHLSEPSLTVPAELKKAQAQASAAGRPRPSHYASSTFTVWFEAWRYQHEALPVIALLQEMRRQFGLAVRVKDSVKAGSIMALKTLTGAFDTVAGLVGSESARLLNPGNIVKAAESYDAEHFRALLPTDTVREFLESAIDELLIGLRRVRSDKPRLVVFIDDLDRCSSDAAYRLLEGLKIHLNLPNCVFVLGMNAHLSIQEYFAALHLQNGVRDLAVSDPQRLQALFEELGRLGTAPAWREALVTFFELPDWSPKVISRLCQAVFGENLERVPELAIREESWDVPGNAALVETLARLVVNPGIALPAALRERGFDRAVAFLRSERRGNRLDEFSGVLAALTVNEEGSRRIWMLLRKQPSMLSGSDKVLDLRGARMVDYSPLADFASTTDLRLQETLIADLAPLAGLRQLTSLSLNSTPVVSLAPLSVLPQLRTLELDQTRVTDLSALEGLTSLGRLSLRRTEVGELAPLAGLHSLTSLSLDQSKVVDLAPLAKLRALRHLSLTRTQVSDLAPLRGLVNLVRLFVNQTGVSDVAPLAQLQQLKTLDLDQSAVTDLSALQGLKELEYLYLNGVPIRSLEPLSGLARLSTLMLGSTQVTDLGPLAGLTKLRSLYLFNSQVKDTSPLAGLTELTIEGGPDGAKAKPKSKPKVGAAPTKPWWRVF